MKFLRSRIFLPILIGLVLLVGAGFGPLAQRAQRFEWILTKKLTVQNDAEFQGDVSQAGDFAITGDFSVTDDTALGNAADDTVSVTGDVLVTGVPDTDAANYNYWFEISGNATGTGTKDRNYPLYIEMTRAAGQEIGTGDHDEAGLKIRVDTEAVTTTTGTVLRAIDAESKADNPSGTVTNLFGASLTAKSDSGAGDVGTMVALTTNAQANAQVTAEMGAADLRLFRQSATEPTSEYVLKVRNSSTTGTGADAGIYLLSDYGSSSTTDSMDYGLDMASAQINTADIRLENGETINNDVDGEIGLNGNVSITGTIILDSMPFTYTDAITISGVLTNVRLLYYQVP